jgi:hypothetical protein
VEWSYIFTILDLGTRWRPVVSFTPWPLYLLLYPLNRRLGGPQSRSGRYRILVVQPVACCYIDRAIPASLFNFNFSSSLFLIWLLDQSTVESNYWRCVDFKSINPSDTFQSVWMEVINFSRCQWWKVELFWVSSLKIVRGTTYLHGNDSARYISDSDYSYGVNVVHGILFHATRLLNFTGNFYTTFD